MNILEVEDKIKGLPDQMLFKEAQMPSGSVPQFLVISEIQRRAKMRQGAKKPPTETVSEKVVQEGIASLMPPQQAPMAPQGIAQAGPQMGMNAPMAQQPRTSPAQPMMMASGGVTKMQTGGQPMVSPFGSGFDPATMGQGEIIDYFYRQQMAQAQAQREAAEQARARAEERGTSLQEQARKDAFNQALVGIGTGIARGDMAGGFAAGSQSAQERMREARQQALRASERGEALALSQEQAARQAELGAGTFGAQQRLEMLSREPEKETEAVRTARAYQDILLDPSSPRGLKEKAKRELFGSDEGASAFDQKVERYRKAYPGRSEEEYLRAALGEIRAFQHPDTGKIEYEDVAGRFFAGPEAPQSPDAVQRQVAEELAAERAAVFRGTEALGEVAAAPERRLTSATGPLQQAVGRGINVLSGALTGTAALPDLEASQEALDIIRKDMARQIATDDGNRLLATIYRDALDDMPSWYTSDSTAMAKAEENIRRMDDGIANAQAILADQNSTKEMRADASAALRSLQLNRQRLYELVTGQPAATGQSSSEIDALVRKYNQ